MIGSFLVGAIAGQFFKKEEPAKVKVEETLSALDKKILDNGGMLGMSFQLNGHTWTILSQSQWDGELRCMSDMNAEIWVNKFAAYTMMRDNK